VDKVELAGTGILFLPSLDATKLTKMLLWILYTKWKTFQNFRFSFYS